MTEPFVAWTIRDVFHGVIRLDDLSDPAAWAVSGNLLVEDGLFTQLRAVLSDQAELQHYRSSPPRSGEGPPSINMQRVTRGEHMTSSAMVERRFKALSVVEAAARRNHPASPSAVMLLLWQCARADAAASAH